MEFHVSRAVRAKTGVSDVLFNFAGNVVFSNLAASREFVKRYNAALADEEKAGILHAAALFSMGLMDELNHAMVARYRETLDPDVMPEALRWLESSANTDSVNKLLFEFSEEFPSNAVYSGKVSSAEWLAQSTSAKVAGTALPVPNREAALEELLMLWIANENSAFAPFRDLFNDAGLEQKTIYKQAFAELPDFFATRPKLSEGKETLLEALLAPVLASPDSLSGQLAYMRDNWSEHLGPEFTQTLKQVTTAVDVQKEEEVAVWMMFHPATNGRHHGEGDGKAFSEGFLGDEFVGFGEGATIGADGAYSGPRELPPPLNEYEAFSPDQAWMPTVVMIAKSTYVWLEQLSKKFQRHIHRLDQIPGEELQLLAERGINALWLIGLWERSSASQTIKRLMGQHDAVASAYSLKDYRIAEDLGGTEAYERLRDLAARYGVRLASDMVPNHMGIDSTWVMEHPEWFLSRSESPFPVYSFEGPDLSTEARFEIKIDDHYFDQSDAAVVFRLKERSNGRTEFVYHGNDGTTFAWNDTAQLDYSKAIVREQVIQTILQVAKLFPIIRFDAAMTLAKKHVQRLWFPLPGIGGSIPSRAEAAISQSEFDAMMPHEFWREVVDRVAEEVPGTLLLAEAFWLLEGYFVRTLGMHRVYNSAFMNMLRDEENAKYRSYLKKTIEFDPDILKRYVNFMSNPDEKTAIAQFGTGDKYFGTCTMLATIPGLPMIGHGQIEAFTEKYGMEYKRARFDEWPNEDLVARHQREIAPLLKNRQLFAESANFVMYDFWAGPGEVNENVFAYSNRVDHGGNAYGGSGKERALVLYNNSLTATRGTVHVSVADMDKYTGQLRQRTLTQALELADDPDLYIGWRDTASTLEYLRPVRDFVHSGFTIDLRGYQYAVLLNWRELYATAEKPWDQMSRALGSGGVYNLDAALSELRLRPLHEALRYAVATDLLVSLASAAAKLPEVAEPGPAELEDEPTSLLDQVLSEADALAVYDSSIAEESNLVGAERILLAAEVMAEPPAEQEQTGELASELLPEVADPLADDLRKRATAFFEQAAFAEPDIEACGDTALDGLIDEMKAVGAIPMLDESLAGGWPAAAKKILPGTITQGERPVSLANLAAILAFLLIRRIETKPEEALPVEEAAEELESGVRGEVPAEVRVVAETTSMPSATALFDRLQLRTAIATVSSGLGLDHESSWRDAARVRVLLANADVVASTIFGQDQFWADGDVRWLAGVSESGGVTYLNKECMEELAWWLQVPRLIAAAGVQGSARVELIAEIAAFVEQVREVAGAAGYELSKAKEGFAGKAVEVVDLGEAEAKVVVVEQVEEEATKV